MLFKDFRVCGCTCAQIFFACISCTEELKFETILSTRSIAALSAMVVCFSSAISSERLRSTCNASFSFLTHPIRSSMFILSDFPFPIPILYLILSETIICVNLSFVCKDGWTFERIALPIRVRLHLYLFPNRLCRNLRRHWMQPCSLPHQGIRQKEARRFSAQLLWSQRDCRPARNIPCG